mmetsp:Transcript_3495/g.5949  ORF Transcript_3495/g.5949 Transcript_3495/m.5949 type:complete len:175 (+) Transcript_3495:2832-3356(+)
MLFEAQGFEVVEAVNGKEAFDEVSKRAAMGSLGMFDAIILDLNMPILNGHEACTKIRQLMVDQGYINYQQQASAAGQSHQISSAPGSREPILPRQRQGLLNQGSSVALRSSARPLMIALSGFVNDETREETRKSGFDSTLMAPLKFQQIAEDIVPSLLQIQKRMVKRLSVIDSI